jgi:glycosyltransferase involved in cell wall biosynthesis
MIMTEHHDENERHHKADPCKTGPHDETAGGQHTADGGSPGNNPRGMRPEISLGKQFDTSRGGQPDTTRSEKPGTAGSRRPDIVWFGPYYAPVGYGEDNRNFICALYHQGFCNLRLIPSLKKSPGFLTPGQDALFARLEGTPVNPGQSVVVQHCTPDTFRSQLRGRVNIGRTMFETDRISSKWVEHCKQMDEIWVPSSFNIETFSRSGIPRHKLRAVPGGVDVNAFHPEAQPLPLKKNGFAFLANFGWVDRKGWDLLLRAYCSEFKPGEDVALVIKTFPYFPGNPIELQCIRFIQQLELGRPSPVINLISNSMPVSSMPGLYTACDAFVLPSRGEGWGLPYLEAMSCGLPVIGTRWSGNLDFMNDDNSYLIEIEGLEDVPARVDMPVYSGHRWAKPSLDHLRHLLRHVYEHRQEAGEKGARARADACEKWSWKQAASAARAELQKFDVP